MDSQSPESAPESAPGSAPPSAPTALADLTAAGLVSHEMIGDPARLGPEAEVLRVLCGLVAGPIWRIEPFHYAFRAEGEAPAEARAATLEAALQAELGPEAVWVTATDLLPEDAPEDARLFDQPLLLLRAQASAVGDALEAAGSGLQAVINAGFAAATARLVAGADAGGPLAARLSAIESRQEAILAALAGVLQRVEAQDSLLQAQLAREDIVAARLTALGDLATAPAAFQETLGLTLAEFLARLERRAEETAPLRVPQFI